MDRENTKGTKEYYEKVAVIGMTKFKKLQEVGKDSSKTISKLDKFLPTPCINNRAWTVFYKKEPSIPLEI